MSLYYYDHLKFGVYKGEFLNKRLNELEHVGDAILIDNNRYYTLRFKEFPKKTFYLVRNNKKSGKYLIFDKKVSSFGFENLVGRGELKMNLKEHLEITLPRLGLRAYMSLFPENIHEQSKGA